jgi:hypothetical protein
VPVLHEGRVRPARGADKDPAHAFSLRCRANIGWRLSAIVVASRSRRPIPGGHRDRDPVRHRRSDHVEGDRGPSVRAGASPAQASVAAPGFEPVWLATVPHASEIRVLGQEDPDSSWVTGTRASAG